MRCLHAVEERLWQHSAGRRNGAISGTRHSLSMTIYWILLAIPALIGLGYSFDERAGRVSLGHQITLLAFAIAYALVALLRFEVGGDWITYIRMYESVKQYPLIDAFNITDPGFAFIMWGSAKLGLEVYFVNGIAALLLALGVIRVAATTRNPWMAVTISVPYLLIVVGMGYVRQAAAIGLVLSASATMGRGQTTRTFINLGLALLLHSTSVVTWPLFAAVMARRNKLQLVLLVVLGSAAFLFFVSSRLGRFESGYIGDKYDSSGALVRLLMGVVPSLVLIFRYRVFSESAQNSDFWLLVALSNMALLVSLYFVQSSTAVDRLALFFAPVQIVVFGEMAGLVGSSPQTRLLLRFGLVGIAVAVQMVWLLYATHANLWVPYKTILSTL